MKILHINTFGWGGAFTGTYRLHNALLKSGVDSKILVNQLKPGSNLKKVYVYNKQMRKLNVPNRIFNKLGFPITSGQKKAKLVRGLKGEFEIISFPFSDFDITQSHEYKDADIIHLHWTAGFLDYKTFFRKNKKPVVFTLRDLSPIMGIFHYEGDKARNQPAFGSLDKKIQDYKHKVIDTGKKTVQVVGISNWIGKMSLKSPMLNKFKHSVIPNCIDTDRFRLLNKSEIRRKYNIRQNEIVFSFVSDDSINYRKGPDLMLKAIEALDEHDNIVIFTVGNGIPQKFPPSIIHRHFGVCSESELNEIYCASDAFIFPTREEAFGNVMLEAMACGTPVIGNPVGGLLDVIKPGLNGLFTKDVSAVSLKLAIEEFYACKDCFDPKKIRQSISKEYTESQIATKYIEVYKSISLKP